MIAVSEGMFFSPCHTIYFNTFLLLLFRFVNDPRCDSCVNAKLKSVDNFGFCDEYNFPPDDVVHSRYYIVAETDIAEGDEIFISYGDEYWENRRNSMTYNMQNNICSFNCMTYAP